MVTELWYGCHEMVVLGMNASHVHDMGNFPVELHTTIQQILHYLFDTLGVHIFLSFVNSFLALAA